MQLHKTLSLLMLSSTPFLTAHGEELTPSEKGPSVEIYQTTRQGDRLARVEPLKSSETTPAKSLTIDESQTFQTIAGIGGSFTESGAQVLYELPEASRTKIIEAYFSPKGAHYSLTRTHIASCDFSVRNYTYAPVAGDTDLKHFSIEPDRTYLLPMIKEAQKVAGADFNILASPWSAPPWMKTNQTWNGGELMPEHYPTFSKYIIKYIEAYKKEGIPIWGITPINEPYGNNSNWESVHFSADQMKTLIINDLGPALQKAGLENFIWIYDQNRGAGLEHWADVILSDEKAAKYVRGTAVHWYESTVDVQGESLDYVHNKFPHKEILHTEGCIDAMGDDEPIGSWLEDDWYWRPEATDWGFIWASEEQKPQHPPYRPFYRYARDLIGGINHNMVGWIDWNMVLNTRGGPNHARNYCLAPVMVDSGTDTVYFTPLYYALAHVSKFVRPGAQRIALSGHDDAFMATAVKNPDGSIALVVFNTTEDDLSYQVTRGNTSFTVQIKGQALQSILIR